MKTVKVTKEGLQSTVASLKGIIQEPSSVPVAKDITLAIDGLQCLLTIQDMLQKG